MVFRIYLANATARDVAEIGQRLRMDGTVTEALGFGAWGVEPTVVAELGGIDRTQVGRFIEALFAAFPSEEAVYVVSDDAEEGEVIYRDGRVT